KALELPVSVEHRQAGHFHRQALVCIVERPEQHDTAESLPRRYRVCDLGLRIKPESLGNLMPAAVKYGSGLRSQQIREFLGCRTEVIFGINLPNKSEGKTVRLH